MKNIALRYCLLVLGTVVMSFGIVLVTESNLGTSPISSFGYVLSLSIPAVSYGTFMLAWNGLLLLAQVAILRRSFKASALLQVPISLLFSAGIDVFTHLLDPLRAFSAMGYPAQLVVLAAGIAVLAFGVACTVVANVAMNCGEALVCAVTSKTGWNFGHTKVGFDLSCVVLAVAASFALLGGIAGVREGTFVAAGCTGLVVNFFVRLMGGVQPPLDRDRRRRREARKEAAEGAASGAAGAPEAA